MLFLDSERSEENSVLQLCLVFILLCIHFQLERVLRFLHAYPVFGRTLHQVDTIE